MRTASSENHSKKFAAYATSPFASAKGLPFSHVMSLARSSALSTIRSYHLRSILLRWRAVSLRNAGPAACAAWMAASVSEASISGMLPIFSCEEGSVCGVSDAGPLADGLCEWSDD